MYVVYEHGSKIEILVLASGIAGQDPLLKNAVENGFWDLNRWIFDWAKFNLEKIINEI